MQKPVLFILTGTFLFIAHFTSAQTVEQILNQHFSASGQGALSKITSVRSTGKAIQAGTELPFMQIQERPGKLYLEIEIQGVKMIQAYNGLNGWAIEPWMSSEPRKLTVPEVSNMAEMARIDNDLVNWEENGYSLEFIGKEVLDGNDVFRLKLTKTADDTYQFFIDSETYLINKMVNYNDNAGKVAEGETILGDYRKINGIAVPFRTEVKYDGQTLMVNVLDKVEFDIELDESFFSQP